VKELRKALVVLDKPKHDQHALKRAVMLQQAAHGAGKPFHLHLVSFCWQSMVDHSDSFDAHQRRQMKKEVVRQRHEWLDEQITGAGLAAADVTCEVVWSDDIAGWIREHEGDADLVVKSVHQVSGTLMHTPLDWQIMRESSKPVLLVAARRRRRRKQARDGGGVLAALDLRHNDRVHRVLNLRVLDAAHLFAGLLHKPLDCVSVIEYSEVLSDLDFIDPRKIRREKAAQNQQLLEALVEPYGVAKRRLHQPAGKVGQLVNATVRKVDADLLVVGTAARRGVRAALLGNSAERILSRAGCDVLVVHP